MSELAVSDHFWGMRALEFVAAARTAMTPDDLLDLFRREIAQAGFTAHLFVHHDARDFADRVISHGWHREWMTLYTQEGMSEFDPVAQHFWRTVDPFVWSDAPFNAEREPRAQTVMDRACDFRMTNGICVPLHYDMTASAVSIAGEKPELGRAVCSAMHLISIFAHYRLRALNSRAAPGPRLLLTRREREVLQWVSAGKSDWDISVILHISERTARAHVTNAARKLNAANRPAAIAEALRTGQISLNH